MTQNYQKSVGVITNIESKVTQKGLPYMSVMIDNSRFNLFDTSKMNGITIGSTVNYTWAQSGAFKNLYGVYPISPGTATGTPSPFQQPNTTYPYQKPYVAPQPKQPWTPNPEKMEFEKRKNDQMIRLGCLRDAIQVLTAQLEAKEITSISKDSVFVLAEEFRKYVEGSNFGNVTVTVGGCDSEPDEPEMPFEEEVVY